MIIKKGHKVVEIYKGGYKITEVYDGPNLVYRSVVPYLQVDKTEVWINPWGEFGILSNVEWEIR